MERLNFQAIQHYYKHQTLGCAVRQPWFGEGLTTALRPAWLFSLAAWLACINSHKLPALHKLRNFVTLIFLQ